jgi:hypothetical protein
LFSLISLRWVEGGVWDLGLAVWACLRLRHWSWSVMPQGRSRRSPFAATRTTAVGVIPHRTVPYRTVPQPVSVFCIHPISYEEGYS